MRRYKSKKSYAWNSEVAYIAGIFASDGCLYNDNRHLNVTSMDTQLLETVISLLNLGVGIKTKKNGYGGTGYYIQFGDVALYDFLFQAGIKPAKSKTIGRIKIPDEYFADFLRGYFDGDGCIYGFWDKRWRSSLMYYTQYTSASPKFLEWLHRKNVKLAKVSKGTIKKVPRALTLSYAKEDSKKLFEFMYYAPRLPALSRKQTKFIDFLRSDPYASRALLARVAESADAPA